MIVKMKNKRSLLLLLPIILLFGYFAYFPSSAKQTALEKKDSPNCNTILTAMKFPFEALIIDTEFLRNMNNGICFTPKKPINIAVNDDIYKKINPGDYPQFKILFYESANNTNYWKIYDTMTRAVPRYPVTQIGKWQLPKNISLFEEYWKRSRMINCLGLDMNRTDTSTSLPPTSLEDLSKLMEVLVSFGMFPFLNGGSLLGWYRECGVIPHTTDMDVGVAIEQFNPEIFKYLKQGSAQFRLDHIFSRPDDAFEFSVFPKHRSNPKIDVFFMYNNGINESWVGGTDLQDGRKYYYVYPLNYDPYCSGDIYGRIFWVTCHPQQILPIEYGSNWKNDHHTSQYTWKSSHFNIRKGGKWSKKELDDIRKMFA